VDTLSAEFYTRVVVGIGTVVTGIKEWPLLQGSAGFVGVGKVV
jgi:hypothetical protein